jgi:hypothetical protein
LCVHAYSITNFPGKNPSLDCQSLSKKSLCSTRWNTGRPYRGSAFNHDFFYATPNRLADWLPADESLLASLRLLKVEDYRPGGVLTLIMNDEVGKAVAFLGTA